MYPYPNPYAQPPQQQWLPSPQQPQVPQIQTHFVSNIEEARNSIADPLCIHIFMDSNCGKIYIKKMNDKGMSEFFVYSQEETPVDPLVAINSRLSKIEHFIGGLHDQSIPGNAGTQQSKSIPQPTASAAYEHNDETESTGISEMAGNDFWKK